MILLQTPYTNYPKFMRYDLTNQKQNEEIFNIMTDIHFYIQDDNVKGMQIKLKYTNSGGKYKWNDGQELILTYKDIKITSGFTSYYEDTNSYKQKDLIVFTNYFINYSGIDFKNSEDVMAYLNNKLLNSKLHYLMNEAKK